MCVLRVRLDGQDLDRSFLRINPLAPIWADITALTRSVRLRVPLLIRPCHGEP